MSALSEKIARLETARSIAATANAEVQALEREIAADLQLNHLSGRGRAPRPAPVKRLIVTPEMIQKILKLDKEGVPRSRIAEQVGVSVAVVYRYLHEAGRTIKPQSPGLAKYAERGSEAKAKVAQVLAKTAGKSKA